MKNTNSLMLSVSSIKDLAKITNDTKYINIDITNPKEEIISYFIKNGNDFLYSEMINNTKGYIYVSYDEFVRAETIINMLYINMPKNLTKLAIAKYLYTGIAKQVCFDINTMEEKNELHNLSLISNVNNIWGSLSLGRVNKQSIAKIYYYILRRFNIDTRIVTDDNENILNEININNQVLLVNLFKDIPYIAANMQTRYFATYNDDIELDKIIKYIKNKYNDYYIDKALKNIDYMTEDCVWLILSKTQNLIDIENIKPVELGIIYREIFDKYCPNYDIKINNLFLNNSYKNHFIMISYNDNHYSYNYKNKTFMKVASGDILENLNIGKIGLYCGEFIPNIGK